jgi:hypothetical protein
MVGDPYGVDTSYPTPGWQNIPELDLMALLGMMVATCTTILLLRRKKEIDYGPSLDLRDNKPGIKTKPTR